MIGSAMLLFIQSLQGAKADYLVMARVKHSQKLSAPLQNHLNSLATPAHDDSSLLPADSEEFWCFCQQPESGEMTACDHVHCPIVWFQSGEMTACDHVHCPIVWFQSGEMTACEHVHCPIVWFHTACVQVKRIPKGNWYCPDCRKIKSKCKDKNVSSS